jgi:dihydrofolate reductase
MTAGAGPPGALGLVWAQSANGVIGRDGALPWQLPEDLARFRALTWGATVVMGRRTWQSLPPRFRPLPGRVNVVLSTDLEWSVDGAVAAHSLPDALERADGDVWVIGGASVFAAALPLADRVEITEIDQSFAGDVPAPQLPGSWRLAGRDPAEGWHESATGLRYRFCSYRREVTSPS